MEFLNDPDTCLWDGEDRDEYRTFYSACRQQLAPADGVEELMVSEFVLYSWEMQRYRNIKRRHIASTSITDLHYFLGQRVEDEDEVKRLISGWCRGDPNLREQVEYIIDGAGKPFFDIQARAFLNHIDTFERMERLILQADSRRSDVLKEMERRRTELARRARDLIDVEEAEIVPEASERASLTPRAAVTPRSAEAAEVTDYDPEIEAEGPNSCWVEAVAEDDIDATGEQDGDHVDRGEGAEDEEVERVS